MANAQAKTPPTSPQFGSVRPTSAPGPMLKQMTPLNFSASPNSYRAANSPTFQNPQKQRPCPGFRRGSFSKSFSGVSDTSAFASNYAQDPSLCRRCHCPITSPPNIQDWKEHWANIVQSSSDLSERLLLIEKELTTLTEQKRTFQKMYMETWGENPPHNITKHTIKKAHGYLADRVERDTDTNITRLTSSASTESQRDSRRGKVLSWLFQRTQTNS
eukprot:3934598-Rhodomonas_salina.1